MTQRPNDQPWAAAPPDGTLSLHERMAIQIERAQPDGPEFLDGLSDEDLGELAMAAAIEAELKEQDAAAGVPGVLPLRRPARPARVLNPRWAALAAVLAGVALIPFAWRGTQGGAVTEPAHAVAMLENPAAGLPEGWVENTGWSRTRSGGDPLTDETLAVRVGASMVNMELAVRARDAEATRRLVDRISTMLINTSTSGNVAAQSFAPLRERAGAPPAEQLPVLKQASEEVESVVDANRFAVGAWVEAARLAVYRRDAAFFRQGRSRRMLDNADALVGDNEEARNQMSAIRALLAPDTPDWGQLGKAVDQLLYAIS